METMLYAIALGSNRRHGRHGGPSAILAAAVAAIESLGAVTALSSIFSTPALGPAGRRFANGALILRTGLTPPALLGALKGIEAQFGRRAGRRWGPRVLDLDILLWSGGAWESDGLVIPHPEYRNRRFVLDPLARIAPDWRDPITSLTVRQLKNRLTAPRPVDPDAARS